MIRKCRCGRKIEYSGRGKPREWCEECRPPRNRGSQVATLPVAAPVEGALTVATRSELEAVGRADSARGKAALAAAVAVDKGGMTAAGLAALLKAHREALDAALEGVRPVSDALDELAGRRAQRFA